MWIRHSNPAVGIILVPDGDTVNIQRLLDDGGVEVQDPNASAPPPIDLTAHREAVQERLKEVATKIDANEQAAKPTERKTVAPTRKR